MQKFRGILRVGFVIAFRMGHFLNDKILITWAAERVPPRAAKTAGKHPDHLAGECASVKGICYTSSKGMPRHAHGRWALMLACGRQLQSCEMSAMCKFHIKTSHISSSQICLSLFETSSTFYHVCVLTYVIERYASTYLRNGGRLNVCGVDDNDFWLYIYVK